VCSDRRVCGEGHVPAVVVVEESVGGLALERMRVTITIGVAEAATGRGPAALSAVTVTAGLAFVKVVGFNVGLQEYKSLVGEVSSREDVADHVDSVFGTVDENGDRVEIGDGDVSLEVGYPESHHVVSTLIVREVVPEARGDTWPEELIFIYEIVGGDQ